MKNWSKFKKLVEASNFQKIVDLLTDGKGKWNATRKNPYESITIGALTEPTNVWFFFLMFSHSTFKAPMYSQGEGSNLVVCRLKGLQIQCW